MRLIVNGVPADWEGVSTVRQLLRQVNPDLERAVVVVGDVIVKAEARESYPLQDGDRVEIFALVGGG